ncbi:MAG TPA: POTRA domain-containing protein [Acidobacteriaceae bacterium]|nr:POTRA domain-containing protein [Acidobacteriaceae bacterium]
MSIVQYWRTSKRILAGLTLVAGGLLAVAQTPPGLEAAGVEASSGASAGQSAGPAPETSVPNAAPKGGAATVTQEQSARAGAEAAAEGTSLRAWAGRRIRAVEFAGVTTDMLAPLPEKLEVQPGQPLDPQKVRDALRQLYATGLYQALDVVGVPVGDEIILRFEGKPEMFVGRVDVVGAKSELLTTELIRSTKLDPGAPYSPTKLDPGAKEIESALARNGFFKPDIAYSTEAQPQYSQVNITYTVDLGKQARVGIVTVHGNPGFSPEEFRKKAKLKRGKKVTRDTTSDALNRLRKAYQKENRLEADVRVDKRIFDPATDTVDYDFLANQGEIIAVKTEGAKLSKRKIKRLVPVYEEGALDEDLLNEGARNIRDYFQRDGFFDTTVTHKIEMPDSDHDFVIYDIDKKRRHKVVAVRLMGNKYFDEDTLRERLNVTKASVLQRYGKFSQSLVTADVQAITILYKANGFNHVNVTPKVADNDEGKIATIAVSYQIEEGSQDRFGTVTIVGAKQMKVDDLRALMNTMPNQPYSLSDLGGDRDAILTYYLSHGFSQAQLDVNQTPDPADPQKVDIELAITEGEQFFVRNLVESGLHYTRQEVVDKQVTIHPGDSLDQSAILETQRKLYNLALFNEVNTSIQNPDGEEQRKNVLLQMTEAKRYIFTYGFGFEVQTGNPSTHCLTPAQVQVSCNPNGKLGFSPKVLFDVTRINFRGRNQSLTLQTAYGLLEQRATLSFLNPQFLGDPRLSLTVSGGYVSSQDVTTYAASSLSANFRVTQSLNLIPGTTRARDTLSYQFSYRRVKVDPNSLQVSPDQIPLLSEPVRVGGPGLNYLRDTRDVPLDATRGIYISAAEFLASGAFGSQADFNRLDVTNADYHAFGNKRKYVLARSTRVGLEFPFNGTVGIDASTANPTLPTVPLPERLYAGGATSHRGFGINQAGPRDLTTGFPIGGLAAFVNQIELRTPTASLPIVGDALSFVLFHDMGNVFKQPSDILPSFLRVNQPDGKTCRVVTLNNVCSFNYFSHAAGLGLRYKTPIGPIRGDFSYNLNPPIYPVFFDFEGSKSVVRPHVGKAPNFNFFFSIGQTF